MGWILKYELSLSSTQHSEADVIPRSLLWGELINLSQRVTMEPVQFPIKDILDSHTFLPREVPDLLHKKEDACQGITICCQHFHHPVSGSIGRDIF
jgi:hypothetical protein